MRRLPLAAAFVVLVSGFISPTTSYAQQSLNFYLGGFVPRSEDARVHDNDGNNDVLVNNLDFLAFRIQDFSGGTAGADYVVGLGEYLDAGLGVGFYQRTVPALYLDFINANGNEIEQDLKLRVVPMTATIRFLPLGRSHGVKPYFGAGLGVFNWRYSESGQFIDFSDGSVFRDSFVGSGTATGPVILGGVSIPLGAYAFGGEVRYQKAHGDLPADEGFAADRIDLGGITYAANFTVRF